MIYFTIDCSGIASFAQERIFFDEQVRFSNKTAIYNELIALNIPIVKRPDEIKFENFKIAQSKILPLRRIAENKGGKLLSNIYIDAKTPLEV